ncbi:MAG: peptidyl-prolyl cis-trans isomerase [Bdellovibrionales bacterium]|nr:peptidyl-prolyl cis-trans isomerase [Bdellovibrionales bacterium]
MIFTPLQRAALVTLCFLQITITSCTSRNENYTSRVVAKVNNHTLTAEKFAENLGTRLKTFNDLSAKDSAVISQAKSAVIQDFIVRVVTHDWAQANQIFVRKEQIDKEVNTIRKQYPDDIAFRKALADEGLSYSRWEENLTHTLLERLVTDALREKIKKPTEEEMKSYYKENKSLFQQTAAVKLRQIVLENEEAAKKISKEISRGKSISSLAKKFSITAEASLNGDLGWIEKGYLSIFDKAFNMPIGQKSKIEKSSFGYHIFEVVDKRSPKTISFDDARKKIQNILMAEAEQAAYTRWLEEQILKAHVFKDDEFIKSVKVQTRSVR